MICEEEEEEAAKKINKNEIKIVTTNWLNKH